LPNIERAIYLDDVQDPGNVGTIIRIADWYGIDTVIRSAGSADYFSAKVIQSCMGSFANMNLYTCSQMALTDQANGIPIIVAAMSGDPLHQVSPAEKFILVMGNEGQGISQLLMRNAQQTITIAGADGRIADSLNVSVATGIICDRLCINREPLIYNDHTLSDFTRTGSQCIIVYTTSSNIARMDRNCVCTCIEHVRHLIDHLAIQIGYL